jgi:hypothetical protein
VKVYGNDGGRHQTTQNGIESFIRNVMFGAASSRFHRPTSGQGLNQTAQNVIKSTRMVIDKVDFFNGFPLDSIILGKEENEAYCRGIPGSEYIIYFTDGGEIKVQLDGRKDMNIRWLDILESEWKEEGTITPGNEVTIKCPGSGNWFALIQ